MDYLLPRSIPRCAPRKSDKASRMPHPDLPPYKQNPGWSSYPDLSSQSRTAPARSLSEAPALPPRSPDPCTVPADSAFPESLPLIPPSCYKKI